MVISLDNVEELIFYDDKIKKLLPECNPIFNQWAFAKQNIGFHQLVKRTLSDFLNSLQEEQIKILSNYFQTTISINSYMDYHIIKNIKLNKEDAEFFMNNYEDYNFELYCNKNDLYITFWR